jgi:biopolymer transport protein ExbB
VAIPALMFHRYLRGSVTGYIVDMEKQAIGLMDALDEVPAAGSPKPARVVKRGEG